MELNELIKELEQAKGPSRRLDVEIYRHLVEPLAEPFKESSNYLGMVWISASKGIRVPFYTESLDAALKLIPKGWYWSIDSNNWVRLCKGSKIITEEAIVANPAIAIVLACLRILESQTG